MTTIYYTTKEVAAMLKISPRTLENWRNLRQGPAFAKFGSRVLYSSEAIAAFAAANTVGCVHGPRTVDSRGSAHVESQGGAPHRVVSGAPIG